MFYETLGTSLQEVKQFELQFMQRLPSLLVFLWYCFHLVMWSYITPTFVQLIGSCLYSMQHFWHCSLLRGFTEWAVKEIPSGSWSEVMNWLWDCWQSVLELTALLILTWPQTKDGLELSLYLAWCIFKFCWPDTPHFVRVTTSTHNCLACATVM